ncbi:hypothetical protein LCGC14_0705970 [marine sediment metagenome]|uniref:Uncharacterized protein n=1 Tax=marine sediment metagenome TaxID=412755 RepID=A0A0F9T2D5_9ZZZZ|nr:hypothetical protein [bacterium]
MKYNYLKFGKSNKQLDYWLELNNSKNIFGRPTAVIFFGKITSEQFKEYFKKDKEDYKLLVKEAEKKNDYLPQCTDLHKQIKPFYEAGETKDTIFVTIYKGKIYLLEPKSEVRDVSSEELKRIINDLNLVKKPKISTDDFKDDILKVMDLEVLKILETDIPYILRTLGTDRYLNSGTCREIKEKNHWGSIQAIKLALGERKNVTEKLNSSQLFKLLSPHQFETLIFLLLINAGVFSPAWRAGSLPDIDIIGINYSNEETITIGDPPIEFKRNEEITLQVKRKAEKKKQNAKYTISLAIDLKDPHFLTSDWVFKAVKKQQKTKEWLENSLKWFIKGTKYNSIFELANE